MGEDSTKALGNVIRIDDERIQDHLKHVVRGSVEETLNALLDAEADRLANMLRAIHAQESREAATKKAEEVIAKLKAMVERCDGRRHRCAKSLRSAPHWKTNNSEALRRLLEQCAFKCDGWVYDGRRWRGRRD